MEENKKAKVVDMKPKKMSYDELNNSANQLSQENVRLNQMNQQLIMRLRTVDNMFKRLDYLFKVLENGDRFNSEFLNKCVEEVELMLTLPDNEEETEEKESTEE